MNQEADIFEAAARLSEADRPAYLDPACAGQPRLRARIEALLRSHETMGFMEANAVDPDSPELKAEWERSQPEERGQLIGHYQLLQQIGEGGFGVVWIAEQRQPVRRRVALKIIKPGMDTREVIARFEQERQTLAMMDHPNIAKVFDAGTTERGRPYFVMELVRGIRITDYCEEAKLPPAERLKLFIIVCHAVQHAHQKGIIHRDLKPSNVLVASADDGTPAPRIIDFGLAKAMQSTQTNDAFHTQVEQMIGTPSYMSPEQAGLGPADIDTRSDVYSLGVLLYELLTGVPPFDSKDLPGTRFDEIRRAIREIEPPKPSTRLTQLKLAIQKSGGTKSALRIPHSAVAQDLDWIVMKALEKDRARRYETAGGLARDIQRFLSSEPVSAGPPSAMYRIRKFSRRHKPALLVISAIAASLIAATMVSIWQAIKATRAEERMKEKALEERKAREEAESMADFLATVFTSPDPVREGITVTVAEMLDKAVQGLEADRPGREDLRSKMRSALARVYVALGLHGKAIPLLEINKAYLIETMTLEASETIAMMQTLAISYFEVGRRDEALKLRQEVLALSRRVNGPEHTQTIKAMHNLGVSYFHDGRRDEARKLRDEVLALSRKVLSKEHADRLPAMVSLATSCSAAGEHHEALKLWEEVVPLSRKVNGHRHPGTLLTMQSLAIACNAAGRTDEALKQGEEALPLFQKTFGPEHRFTLKLMTSLASYYEKAGQLPKAIALQEESLAVERRVLEKSDPSLKIAIVNLANYYEKAGRKADAAALREEVAGVRSNPSAPVELEPVGNSK